MALLILTLITAIILGLVAGPTNPLTWALVALLVIIPFIHRRLSAKHFIQWKDEYNVGIESIDQQHRKLVSLINQLQTAVDYSTGEEFEREALDELVDYTKTHFGFEEGMMEQYDYPDLEPHKAQHRKMIAKVEEVLAEYEQDHDRAMFQAVTFLKDWLINHINGTDKQYSSFLIEKGAR
ncbi:MAG: bacteriohemerythrin [Thiogranum sp.]